MPESPLPRRILAIVLAATFLAPAFPLRSAEEAKDAKDAKDAQYEYLELQVREEGTTLVQLIELVKAFMERSPKMKAEGRVKGFQYTDDIPKAAVKFTTGLQIPIPKGLKAAHATADQKAEAMYNFLLSVLEIYGYSLADRGMFYEVVKSANKIKKPGMRFLSQEQAIQLEANDELITQMFTFRNFEPQFLATSPINNLLIRDVEQITPITGTRIVLITAYASKLQQIYTFLKLLDDKTSDVVMEFVPLVNATATEIVDTLKNVIRARSQTRSRPQGAPGAPGSQDPQIFANPRTNKELVVICSADDLKDIQLLIQRLDLKLQFGEANVKYFKIKHRPAKDVKPLIDGLYSERQAVTGQAQPGQPGQPGRPAAPVPTPMPSPSPLTPGSAAGGDRPDLDQIPPRVVLDEGTNSLIVIAPTPKVLGEVERLIDQVDRRRPQVMLEAVAMELGPSASRALGVELAFGDEPGKNPRAAGATAFGLSTPDFSTGQPTRTPGAAEGLTGFIFKDSATRIPFLIQLQQQDSISEVLAAPRILANDNEEATFSITNQEPYLTQSVTPGGVTTTLTAFTEAKTELKIKPSISIDRLPKRDKEGRIVMIKDATGRMVPDMEDVPYVRMDISQTLSSFQAAATTTAGAPPAKQERLIKTNTAVLNEATIVIGGFTNKTKRKSISKVPLLGDIPLLGWLFRSEKESESTSTLFVFITPHIRDSLTDLVSLEDKMYTQKSLERLKREKQEKGIMPLNPFDPDYPQRKAEQDERDRVREMQEKNERLRQALDNRK